MTDSPGSQRPQAALALGALSLIWGINWVVMKIGLSYASPLALAGWRFLLAGSSFIPVLWWRRQPVLVPRAEWRLVVALSVLLSLNFGCTFFALSMGGTGKTAVLVYTMPFWVVLLAHTFLHERMRTFQWVAVGLAASGLLTLVAPNGLKGVVPSALAVLGGLFWGASIVMIKARQAEARTHVLALTVWQMLLSAPIFFGASALLEDRATEWTSTFVASLTFMTLVASTVAWALFYFALARLPAGVTGLGTLATPVLGAVAAWIHFGERPSLVEAAGMLLIVLGIGLLLIPVGNRGTIRVGSDREAIGSKHQANGRNG